jgi:high affinity Mn2+ porin
MISRRKRPARGGLGAARRRGALALAIALGARPAAADGVNLPTLPDWLAIHGQATLLEQGHPSIRSPYRGANSLSPSGEGRETADATLYLGVRPWRGAELWANAELDQGFGVSNTLGIAGFPSGEAYKVGSSSPYLQLHRLFLRQTIGLGGGTEDVAADLNQFAGQRDKDRIVLTAGKFGVTDIFDTNKYAHDPRGDFMNWAVIDAGTFDYAANAWGYTIGAAAEVYKGDWTGRLGVFDLSDVPNSASLDKHFSQHQAVAEIERRFALRGRPGAVRLTGFVSSGRMGTFADALALAAQTGEPASTAPVRRRRNRPGVSFNIEQEVAGDVGVFARAGWADGDVEPYEFADIDRTVSAGVSLGGRRWGRDGDTAGAAFVVNAISRIHQQYLDAGGLGILVGDGQLPHPGDEQILEGYYSVGLVGPLKLTLDAQYVRNPAYNRDRGPVPLFAARLHAQF